MRETLLGKTPGELKEAALKVGLPAYAGKQQQAYHDKHLHALAEAKVVVGVVLGTAACGWLCRGGGGLWLFHYVHSL